MNDLVSIIVISDVGGDTLRRSVESVASQSHDRVEVVIVEASPRVDRVMASAISPEDVPVRVVEAESGGPGAWRNAGVRASQGNVLVSVEEGDWLQPSFCADALRALTRDGADYAIAPALMSPGDAPLAPEIPARLDARAVAGATWCAPAALMFRRSAWDAVGGFDETLDVFEEYDFLLRLCRIGARGAVLERAGLRHPAARKTRFRQALDSDAYHAGLLAILERHGALFEADPAAVVFGRERLLRELVAVHRHRVARRDEQLERLRRATYEAGRIRTFLQQEDRDGFDWGDFDRTSPVSRNWGYDRGTPIDRHYIQQFVERHAADVRGVVLEVQENDLRTRVGGSRVTRSDVVDINRSNPRATIVGDLRRLEVVADDFYDCIILTQTLHVIDDMRRVVTECRRILKPGGVLLATLPSSSRVCLEYGRDGDFWRVTEAGARALFAEAFPADRVQVRSFGNVQVNVAFLEGLACEELEPGVFEAHDPYFPLVVGVRAVKPDGRDAPRPRRGSGPAVGPVSGAILLYHRVAEPSGSDVHGLCLRPEDFARQMAALRKHFRPMPLLDLVDAARRGALPEGAVAVTFDDGYLDAPTTARPILESQGIPATFFVTTERLSVGHEFWWDALERALLDARERPEELSLPHLGVPISFDMRTPQERRNAFWDLYGRMQQASVEVREAVVTHLLSWSGAGATPPVGARRMTETELRALAQDPAFAIGAHGMHHLKLPAQSEDTQRDDVAACKRALEEALGRTVVAFAYPFGDWSAATERIVRQAGFTLAVTCDDEPVRPGDDPWRLPRFEVKPDVGPYFERRLRAFLDRV